jgi:hypothetical protein
MSELTDYTNNLLKEYWKSCGLEDGLRRQLEKQSNELREGRKWRPKLAQFSVEYATNLALSLANKWKKPECHYLSMALKNKWVINYYQSMIK